MLRIILIHCMVITGKEDNGCKRVKPVNHLTSYMTHIH